MTGLPDNTQTICVDKRVCVGGVGGVGGFASPLQSICVARSIGIGVWARIVGKVALN